MSTRCSQTFAVYSDWIVSRSWLCNMTAPLCTPVGLCVNGAMDGLISARYTWIPWTPAQSRSSMITDVIWPSTYFAAKLRKRKSPWTYRASADGPLPGCLHHTQICSPTLYSNNDAQATVADTNKETYRHLNLCTNKDCGHQQDLLQTSNPVWVWRLQWRLHAKCVH